MGHGRRKGGLTSALENTILSSQANHSLTFDPATVTSELWGESYEGCVPGYGGAYAQFLGLQIQPNMRFEMTVFDSRFLYQSKVMVKVSNLPRGGAHGSDRDIEAAVFKLWDNS